MPDQIQETVFAGGNLFLELLVSERADSGVETAGDELPCIQGCVCELFFDCHVWMPFEEFYGVHSMTIEGRGMRDFQGEDASWDAPFVRMI
jgi:hypothetical protein